MHTDEYFLAAFYGPCRLTESSKGCFISLCCLMHGYAHYLLYLLSIHIRRLLTTRLNMSERSRKIHRLIVKGLLLQALLPTLYTVSVGKTMNDFQSTLEEEFSLFLKS
ncbi:hypothetical protein PRIPAC_80257 [Pristionchus pacificus]|uniref:G protein-coupled receptor n=1 Tax=Pristionchus pacificus TaxID=54126 RepID=A0A2A6C301_PRIPA|nr:hypothetical protein PRIPAC_80257 [Pristionchus pacificus]|eukprot:PDM72478.1 G protein-coupled receptor [Pristionchus pacificus]